MSDNARYQEFIKKHGACFELFMRVHLAFHTHAVELALLYGEHDEPIFFNQVAELYTMLPAKILFDIGAHFGLSTDETITILRDCDDYLQTIGAVRKPSNLN